MKEKFVIPAVCSSDLELDHHFDFMDDYDIDIDKLYPPEDLVYYFDDDDDDLEQFCISSFIDPQILDPDYLPF